MPQHITKLLDDDWRENQGVRHIHSRSTIAITDKLSSTIF